MCYCQWLFIAADAHNTWIYISSQIELSKIMKSNHWMPYNQKVNETIFVSLLHLFVWFPHTPPPPPRRHLLSIIFFLVSLQFQLYAINAKQNTNTAAYMCVCVYMLSTICCYGKTKRLTEIVRKREWERVSQQNQMNEVSEHIGTREWKMPPVNHQIHASSQHIIDSKTFSMENELMRQTDANIAAWMVCVRAAIQSDSWPHHELDFTFDDGCRCCHHWIRDADTDAQILMHNWTLSLQTQERSPARTHASHACTMCEMSRGAKTIY